tara:strand:+ start:377 stop:619 length:243 start_codon:yes stop_codon:yes gene_type:complete
LLVVERIHQEQKQLVVEMDLIHLLDHHQHQQELYQLVVAVVEETSQEVTLKTLGIQVDLVVAVVHQLILQMHMLVVQQHQ